MRIANIDTVRAGDVLAQSIMANQGALLIVKGTVLDEHKIRELKATGLSSLYIEDAWSAGIETSLPLSDSAMIRTLRALYSMDIDAVVAGAMEMVDRIASNMYENDMLLLKTYDDYTVQHSINVAILSSTLAKAIGMDTREVRKVAQAGLLHDIGKMYVPLEILNKRGTLNDEEFKVIRKHAENGYRALQDRKDVWSVVRVAVLEHHENEDGTGYPRGIKGDEIHNISKIIHIADVYDALVTQRSYKDAWTPYRAKKEIERLKGKAFDARYADLFCAAIPMYLKGTVVMLSNGKDAIVEQNFSRDASKPLVRLRDGSRINLLTETDITIVNDDYTDFGRLDKVLRKSKRNKQNGRK